MEKIQRMKIFMARRIALSNKFVKVVTHLSCVAIGMVAGALLQVNLLYIKIIDFGKQTLFIKYGKQIRR